jgi:hypothetical protein
LLIGPEIIAIAVPEIVMIVSTMQIMTVTEAGIAPIAMPEVVPVAAIGTEVTVGIGMAAVVIVGSEGLLMVMPHVFAYELPQGQVDFGIRIGQTARVKIAWNRRKRPGVIDNRKQADREHQAQVWQRDDATATCHLVEWSMQPPETAPVTGGQKVSEKIYFREFDDIYLVH